MSKPTTPLAGLASRAHRLPTRAWRTRRQTTTPPSLEAKAPQQRTPLAHKHISISFPCVPPRGWVAVRNPALLQIAMAGSAQSSGVVQGRLANRGSRHLREALTETKRNSQSLLPDPPSPLHPSGTPIPLPAPPLGSLWPTIRGGVGARPNPRGRPPYGVLRAGISPVRLVASMPRTFTVVAVVLHWVDHLITRPLKRALKGGYTLWIPMHPRFNLRYGRESKQHTVPMHVLHFDHV